MGLRCRGMSEGVEAFVIVSYRTDKTVRAPSMLASTSSTFSIHYVKHACLLNLGRTLLVPRRALKPMPGYTSTISHEM